MIKTTLLTSGNQKILKGEKLGYITKGIHLAPANLSGYEVCQWRSKGCTMACLNTAGRGQMQRTQDSRIAKTKLFFEERFDFATNVAYSYLSICDAWATVAVGTHIIQLLRVRNIQWKCDHDI